MVWGYPIRTKFCPSSLRSWIGALLLLGSMIVFLSSGPLVFHAIELANQEYFRWWPVRHIAYDIEIDGVPFTIAEAIRWSMMHIIVWWGIAVALLIAGCWCFRTRRTVIKITG